MLRSPLISATLLILWLAVSAEALQAGHFILDADQMKAALRTACIEENGFIDRVLDLVKQDKLPVDLVYSTFLWARRKPAFKFQYFQRGLTLRARWIGVKL